MIAIEAGPIELEDKKNKETVTLCLMSDFTVSERRYSNNSLI